MTLHVDLAINEDDAILQFEIHNCGPLTDLAPGVVRYEWNASDGRSGAVPHHPDRGAAILAYKVVKAYCEQKGLHHTASTTVSMTPTPGDSSRNIRALGATMSDRAELIARLRGVGTLAITHPHLNLEPVFLAADQMEADEAESRSLRSQNEHLRQELRKADERTLALRAELDEAKRLLGEWLADIDPDAADVASRAFLAAFGPTPPNQAVADMAATINRFSMLLSHVELESEYRRVRLDEAEHLLRALVDSATTSGESAIRNGVVLELVGATELQEASAFLGGSKTSPVPETDVETCELRDVPSGGRRWRWNDGDTWKEPLTAYAASVFGASRTVQLEPPEPSLVEPEQTPLEQRCVAGTHWAWAFDPTVPGPVQIHVPDDNPCIAPDPEGGPTDD